MVQLLVLTPRKHEHTQRQATTTTLPKRQQWHDSRVSYRIRAYYRNSHKKDGQNVLHNPKNHCNMLKRRSHEHVLFTSAAFLHGTPWPYVFPRWTSAVIPGLDSFRKIRIVCFFQSPCTPVHDCTSFYNAVCPNPFSCATKRAITTAKTSLCHQHETNIQCWYAWVGNDELRSWSTCFITKFDPPVFWAKMRLKWGAAEVGKWTTYWQYTYLSLRQLSTEMRNVLRAQKWILRNLFCAYL